MISVDQKQPTKLLDPISTLSVRNENHFDFIPHDTMGVISIHMSVAFLFSVPQSSKISHKQLMWAEMLM